jgi:galactonate dehydratase
VPARATITAIRTMVCDTGQGRTWLFVLLDTDAGLTGVGEGSQNDQDAAVVANVRQLAPRYVGHDALEVIESRGRLVSSDRSGRAISVAVSAVEQALWDVAGKLLGVPVYQLLGGRCRERLPCYATMAAGVDDRSPEGLAREAARCVAAGYSGVKVVPFAGQVAGGAGGSGRDALADGVARVAAVRQAIGPRAELMIECGFALDLPAARRAAALLEPYDPAWLEAPLYWDDAAELARLRAAVPVRLASGETLHGRKAFRALIEQHAVDVLQPDVKWTGGILEAKKIAAWAEAYQMAVAPHNNSGPVATAASAHLGATLPNFLILETPSRVPAWQEDLTRGTAVVRGGCVSLEDLRRRPGLGIEFDEAVARRHELTW